MIVGEINFWTFFFQKLRPESKILDAGCGSGIASRYMADKGSKVIGVDISEGMLKITRRDSPDIDFRRGDLRVLVNINEVFDGILALASLLHIPHLEINDVLARFYNKLREEGFLMVG